MRKHAIVTLVCIIGSACASVLAQPTHWKFDFGSGKTAAGYIPVSGETVFNNQRGYGFNPGSAVSSVDRGGNALTGDFVTSSSPFYFSVIPPDGNYDIKILLGDTKGISATTVRVENRRLMLENIRTAK